jgi:hypothetical protein
VNNINKWNQVQEELALDTASPSASLVIFFGSFVTTGITLFSSLYPILADHPSEGFWHFHFNPRIGKRNIATSRN